MRRLYSIPLISIAIAACSPVCGQTTSSSATLPRVVIPTSRQPIQPQPTKRPAQLYPWRQNITATVFWVGEQPTQNNPTPNCKSSWDQNWMENFGGYDDPKPANRIADHRNSDFRPKAFIPKLNPFYIALPYNDVRTYRSHKPEASRVIPWFKRVNPRPGRTSLKGQWVQIYHGGRSCYAQWEDCGPWVTDDWHYVFGNSPPKNRSNQSAAIDISPSVRDYLGLQSGEKCHWRFVEAAQVPYGPWKKYGHQPTVAADGSDFEAKRKYLEYLRKLRDAQYQKQGGASR
ncbi:hypothetical protein [Haloferula rosea]|uniref:hypothetical protein n=1 Tax=Haloferula rosea TaxID=490093 RepID=UPI001F160561|nr:hypothetical protein [Haloferula rosea]